MRTGSLNGCRDDCARVRTASFSRQRRLGGVERERRDAPPPRFPLKPKTKTEGARGEGELWRAKRGELKFMNGFERRRIKIHGGIIAGSSKTKERDELGAHSPSRATEIIPDTRVSASQTSPTPTRLFIRPPSSPF